MSWNVSLEQCICDVVMMVGVRSWLAVWVSWITVGIEERQKVWQNVLTLMRNAFQIALSRSFST